MKLKKHIKEVIITLLVISITGISYAALLIVSPSDPLTDSIWNSMVSLVNQNEAKLNNISSVGENVGIGTVSPTKKLVVSGGDIQIEQLDGKRLVELENLGGYGNINIHDISGANTVVKLSGNLTFFDTGDVGIGTKTPTSKLHVEGDTKLNGVLTIGSGQAARVETNGSVAYHGSDSSAISLRFVTDISNNLATQKGISVLDNGKVGIGVLTPNDTLHVDGRINLNDSTTLTGDCDSSTEYGRIAFNNDHFYGCTTRGWRRLELD